MVGLIVFLVVMESCWELVGTLKLVLSGDMTGAEEEPHYTHHSTISPAFTGLPASPTIIELPPVFDLTPIAATKENIPHSL